MNLVHSIQLTLELLNLCLLTLDLLVVLLYFKSQLLLFLVPLSDLQHVVLFNAL